MFTRSPIHLLVLCLLSLIALSVAINPQDRDQQHRRWRRDGATRGDVAARDIAAHAVEARSESISQLEIRDVEVEERDITRATVIKRATTATKGAASVSTTTTTTTAVRTTTTTRVSTTTTTKISTSIKTTTRTTTTTRPLGTTTTTATTTKPTTTTTTTTRATTTTTTTTKPATTVTVTRTSTVCAASYTGGATTISGTGTLPKPSVFATRNGRQIQVSGSAYRPVGPNIYWLGLDENVGIAYPSKQRVREALAIAVAMGANTIRAHTLGISLGASLTVEPTLGTFSETAFEMIDYALYAAREYGLRVIIPLTDEYEYYHGGKYTFLDWLGKNTSDWGSLFYTDTQTITAYKTYISKFLNRVNSYTNVAYKNDPTILAWETGNELGGYIGAHGYPPLSWTNAVAGYIKGIDTNHLVIDGTNGFWNYTTGAVAAGVNSSYIDIMSDHMYPLNTGIMSREETIVTNYNKGFIIGEFDWTGLYGGSATLDQFISAVEATDYMGDLLWSVFGHDDQCCKFVTHSDGYSLYYPNGNTASLQANALKVAQHWYRMTGRTAPSSLPGVACPQASF